MANFNTFDKKKSYYVNIWDVISILAIFTIFIVLAKTATGVASPYQLGQKLTISLDTHTLVYYSLRSVLRMAIALFISLIFSLIIGYMTAKSKKAEMIFIPLIDVLQSIPILGFLSISVVGFIWLFPNNLLGPECAAIFAIFTSQAWNMTLSIYQSIKLLPSDYHDVGYSMNLNAWQRFWRIELPYSTPSLLWNMMISLSGGWFFVVASEAISVNNQEIFLPGIGSYIQTAINQSNMEAIAYALLAMLIVIFIYDQIIFRPLLTVASQFQDFNDDDDAETTNTSQQTSWVYDILQRTNLVKNLLLVKDYLADFFINQLANYYKSLKLSKHFIPKHFIPKNFKNNKPIARLKSNLKFLMPNHYKKVFFNMALLERFKTFNIDWFASLVIIIIAYTLYVLFDFIDDHISISEILWVVYLGFITGVKIFALVIICSFFWLPVGVYIGSKPKLSSYLQPIIQFLAAFPANSFYPILGMLIIKYSLNVDIATAPLLIIGTQWYILFNIIAGINNIPKDLNDTIKNFQVRGALWWRKFMLPAIFPHYITGAMTAAGGAWNASIVAESLSWGDTEIIATGLGSYIVAATSTGDFARIALGITVMSIYVILLNKFIWQRLYNLAARRYQLA